MKCENGVEVYFEMTKHDVCMEEAGVKYNPQKCCLRF